MAALADACKICINTRHKQVTFTLYTIVVNSLYVLLRGESHILVTKSFIDYSEAKYLTF